MMGFQHDEIKTELFIILHFLKSRIIIVFLQLYILVDIIHGRFW